MARDWVAIARRVEAHVNQATGGTSYDDTLRYMLVPFANDVMAEVDREQRWLLAYAEPLIVTVAGTQTYTLTLPSPPVGSANTSNLTIKRVYWRDAQGKPHELLRYDKSELQRMYGDPTSTNPNRGQPKYFALEPATSQTGGINQSGAPAMQLILYPTPDASGPDSTNYTLRVGGYWATAQIVETRGSTAAASGVLTFTTAGAGTYVNFLGVPIAGDQSTVSVREAGYPTALVSPVNDDLVATWTVLAANTVTMSVVSPTTTTNAQVFFNSSNWMISFWPKVILFGVLREVASYYGDQTHYPIWEARFQEQLERMRKYDFDRSRGFDQEALAVSGQLAASLRRIDGFSTIDVRG